MTTPATPSLRKTTTTAPIVYRLPLDNTEAVCEFDFEDTTARTLAEFPDYAFTADGRVLSFKQRHPRPLSPGKADGVYRYVNLPSEGRRKSFLVHRLVARAFIPNPEGKSQVNHLDGNPANNAASNLEWVTQAENQQHAQALRKRQNRSIRRSTAEQLAQAVVLHRSGQPIPAIAEALNIPYRAAAKAIAAAAAVTDTNITAAA